MVIEEALLAHLKAAAGLKALVGTRVFASHLPDDAGYPAVVFNKVSGVREYSHQGPAGLASPRFTLSCWGSTYETAKKVANQAILALSGYSGAMGGGVEVNAVFLDDENDLFDETALLYHVELDFIVWHRE